MSIPGKAQGSHCLTSEDITAVFPYYFTVDRNLEIKCTGVMLQHILPDMAIGAPLQDHLHLILPKVPLSWNDLIKCQHQVCMLKHKASDLLLRGQIVITGQDNILFLVTPWLTSSEQLEQYGLQASDLPQHDPAIQQFQLMLAQQSDITDARRMAETLKQQREELRKINKRLIQQEQEHRKLALIAAKTDNSVAIADREGRIEWVNEAFEKMTGFTLAEIQGKKPGTLLQCEETDPKDIARIADGLKQAQSFTAEILNRSKSGRKYWVEINFQPILDEHGNVLNHMAIERDITKRKQDMDRVNRLASEMQAIFELSPDGFVSFNEFGHRSYVNPAFLRITGLTRDELENVSLQEFDHIIQKRCDPSKPTLESEDGTVMHLSEPKHTVVKRSIREAQDAQNNHIGVVQYFRDITHETELERMKGQFLSMAAHELRTPMASIHGFTELLLKRNFDAPRQRDMLETIFRQSSRLIQMINDLLDLARIEARAGQAFDIKAQPLEPIIRSTVDALIVDKKHQVDFQLPEKLPLVAVDHDKLTQALTNVLSNAYKYSPDGGIVSIRSKHQTIRQREYIGISVKDQGIGMTKDQVERVFDRFFRADTSGKIPGTGLGMCLVKEIMDVHGGSVEVDSEYGEGTEVTLWLPELNEAQKFSEITMW